MSEHDRLETLAKYVQAQIGNAEKSEDTGGMKEASYWTGYLNAMRDISRNLKMLLDLRGKQ